MSRPGGFGGAIRAAKIAGAGSRFRLALAYGVAAVSVGLAVAVRTALDPILGERQPFASFYVAVAVAAWFGGLGPSLLALGLGLVCAYTLFIAPYQAGFDSSVVLLSLIYLFVGLVLVGLSRLMRRAEGQAEERSRALAEGQVALRQSEERLGAIIGSATDAVITIDASQRIVIFNAAAERMFRCPATETIGEPLDRFIPPAAREHHRGFIRGFAETGVSTRAMGGERVLSALRSNGEEFPMEAQISQAVVGGQKLFTAIIRDVTERQRAQREREELLRAAQQARGELEATLEVVGRIQSITEVALADLPLDQLLSELIRRVRDAVATDTATILLLEEGMLRARAAVGLEEEVRAGGRVPVGKGFAGRIAKERRPIVVNEVDYDEVVNGYFRAKGIRSLAGVPLLSGEGGILGVLHVGSVRPRRFGDDEVRLLQLAAERVTLGIERAARIEAECRGRDQAEVANRAKDEFLAMLGHELRNPLSAVRNAVLTASLDESRRAQALDIARRQTDQLRRLIDDLLDVARATQGRLTLRRERVSLSGLIEGAVEATRSLVEQGGHDLFLSLPPDDVRIEADPARVEQVIVNLLTNATKYTGAGGRISVTLERQGAEAVIRVRDSGIGIAPEMLSGVFDLFTQADRSLDRAQGGLGVGLTVARRLVELHGGRIEARSEGLGKGAEFVVWMPALAPAAEETTHPTPAQTPRRGRARVLIIEDNPDAADTLMMLLELLGHSVRVVYDGVAGIEAARANVPDVMLVDIGLPGMDGYEVARRVRRDPHLEQVVLVALTGYGREKDKQQAVAAGFDHHLVKPVTPDALQALLARS